MKSILITTTVEVPTDLTYIARAFAELDANDQANVLNNIVDCICENNSKYAACVQFAAIRAQAKLTEETKEALKELVR